MKVKVISLPYIFLVLYVLCFTRPRYQVSVYRTIGPLVLLSYCRYFDETFTAMLLVFSSPEPSGSQGELIVYLWSGVRRTSSSIVRPHFSNIFSSETAWPIKAKFYVEPPWGGGTKVYINDPGHMTKMAATPIYGKNPSKIFFSRTGGPIFTKLGM